MAKEEERISRQQPERFQSGLDGTITGSAVQLFRETEGKRGNTERERDRERERPDRVEGEWEIGRACRFSDVTFLCDVILSRVCAGSVASLSLNL